MYVVAVRSWHVILVGVLANKVQIFCVWKNTLYRQINPTWNVSGFFRLDITFVEISFLAILEPLSVSRFEVIEYGFVKNTVNTTASEINYVCCHFVMQITKCKVDHSKREQTQVFCLRCPSNSHPTNPIAMEAMPAGAVQIENSNLVLLFDEDSRMLKQVRALDFATPILLMA